MTTRNTRLSALADFLVFAFPILILCVPRGAGVFLAGVLVLLVAGWRGMAREWRHHTETLVPLLLAVFAFLVVSVVSKFYHQTPWNVLDNPSRALVAIVTCWVIVRAAPNPSRLWSGVTVGLFLALLTVIFQRFVLHVDRPGAWVQVIAFANMAAALALVGFARPGQDRRTHATAWFNVICALLILILNGTRGAMVAMLITMFPLLLVRYRGFSARMFLAASGGLVALAIGLCLIPGSPMAERMNKAATEVEQYEQGHADSSVGARLEMWKIGMGYFAEHPWTGSGIGQFAKVLRATPYCDQNRQSGVCAMEHAHNDIVEAASTTGLPGLLALLGLFLVPAALFWRALRACHAARNAQGESLGGAGLAVVMASLVSGLTQVTLAHQANIVFYAGVVGLLLGMAAREARIAQSAEDRTVFNTARPVTVTGSARSA